jgi:hypothetical protein
MREIRVSPDGNAIAIKTDSENDAWNAYGVIHAIHGGHWIIGSEVKDWEILRAGSDD